MLLFLLFGLVVFDADLAMHKKLEVKSLLELANHDATFAVNQALKTEGIIDLNLDEAMDRFERRMEENGGYSRQGALLQPSRESVTSDPLSFTYYYIDFQHWQRDVSFSLRYDEDQVHNLQLIHAEHGDIMRPEGGYVEVEITTEDGEILQLSPKRMVGPSLVVVAYVDEQPFTPLLSGHAFPVVSVEELKW
ncbi:hypothetical protein LOK74_21690 [Brevibacillus humidisoli]|nr:hypothetical protein [Brevibacillus humidisoli]UFJ43406.1 hypothetical protein LOK74_21690 [Brevibacillus humidisoli]